MSLDNKTPLKTPEAYYEGFLKALVENKVSNVTDLIHEILSKETPMDRQQKIAHIDKLKSWLDSFRPLSADVVRELKKYYDVKFTYHTNAIEGSTLTQSETELILEKGITVGGKTLVEHLEAVGHKDAIDYVESLAQINTPIREREVKDIHHLILKSVDSMDAGRYRMLDVRAAGTGHTYPAFYLVNELMEQFFLWLESEEAKELHPVALAAEVHFRFVAIHPFKDGNGRTAHLLMNLVLLRHGYPVAVISNANRSQYIDSLIYAQENGNDTNKLLEIILDAAEETFVDYLRVASTAASSKGKGSDFYADMEKFLLEKNK